MTQDTSICPKAVCLPHLAAGEYAARKTLPVPSQACWNLESAGSNMPVESSDPINAAVLIYTRIYCMKIA